MAVIWPLIGRAEELALVDDAVRSGGAVVLAGAAGVGKTRLAAEAIAKSAELGLATRWVVGTRSANAIPFAALATLAPLHEDADARLAHLLAATRDIAEQAGGRLVVGVDDAHLLDAGSASLVHSLGTSRVAALIVTLRSGERAPDSIVALWADGLAERVELQPLGDAELADLVRAAVGGDVEDATLHRLAAAAAGNALFLRELVLDGLESGALAESQGIWRWMGARTTGLRLRDVVEARIGSLDEPERDAIETLALGEPLGVDLLASLADPDAVERLERRGLIVVDPDPRRTDVRLAHPLYGEVVRSSVPALRGRAIRRRLVDALATAGARRRTDAVRLAVWSLESGTTGRATDLVTAAHDVAHGFVRTLARRLVEDATTGPAAESTSEVDTAERLARAAWTSDGSFGSGIALAEYLHWQRRDTESLALIDEVEALAGSEEDRAKLARERGWVLFFGLGRTGDATAVVGDAELATPPSPARDALTSLRAGFALHGERPAEAIAIASELISRGEATVAEAHAAVTAAGALAVMGASDEALVLVDRFVTVASAHVEENPLLVGEVIASRLTALRLAGRLDEAESLARTLYELSLAQDVAEGVSVFGAAIGLLALDRGLVRTALRRLLEAEALFRERDTFVYLPWCLASIARAHALAGEAATAEAVLAESLSMRSDSVRVYAIEIELAEAWVAATRGSASDGAVLALEAANRARDTGQHAYEVRALHDAARLGRAADAAPRMAELAATVDGPQAPAFAAHAAALAARDAAALVAASVSLEAIGAVLAAAEAAAAGAREHERAASPSAAKAAAARSSALVARCEGARTPALVDVPSLVPLTDREREVARLAAQGLTNPQIAQRLVVSARTVEGHLQRVYSKLGTNDRNALRELAR